MSTRPAALVLLLAGLAGCAPAPEGRGGADASVASQHAAVRERLDLDDRQAFDDAMRGFIAAPSGVVRDAAGEVIWDFAAFDFVDGEAPPTVNPSLWRQARLNNHAGLFKVTDRIWQLRGFDIANLSLIEGETGWIVVDPLTSREAAATAMAFARQHLGDRPVSAIVYTHSHVDHFGGVLGVVSAEEAAARAIPVVAPVGFMEEATSENVLLGVAMVRRSEYMYGKNLPRDATGLVDNGLGKAVAYGNIGLLPPTLVVTQPTEEHVIDGVRFVFHNVPGTEAPSEFTFALPELKAFNGAELVSQTLHNLYTIRGAKVRDALRWANDIDATAERLGDAEVLFNQHHWPVWGNDEIRGFLAAQGDVYRYLHDQTVRLMNAGLTAPEIAETLELPEALDRHLATRGYYGTVRHNIKAIYQFYLGWYDAHPANLDPLPPVPAAQGYVALAGGMGPLLDAARAAQAQGQHRWAAELLKHAVYAEPGNAEARGLLAVSFEQLGFAAEASTWRNAYLTGAREALDGAPAKGFSPTRMRELLARTPVERFLERMAASIDGPAAGDLDLTINLVLTDRGESHVLPLRNGVLRHRAAPDDPAADATLRLTHAVFLDMMTGQAGAGALLTSDEVTIEGSTLDLGRFFSLVEKPPGNFPILSR